MFDNKIKNTSSDERLFVTKGDNNKDIDLYPVKENQVNGVVKLRIPYVGYSTIILNEILNNGVIDKVKVDKGRVS